MPPTNINTPTQFQTNQPIENLIKSQQQNKLIDLQVYQEAKKPPMPKQTEFPMPPINVTTPYLPPQMQSQFNNFMKNMYTPFIYKDYHINLSGPNDNHMVASMIYEDALPPASIYSSFKSLKERNSLCHYARGTFIQQEEGENIDFNGGKNSLNSRLKLIELNPYNTNYFSNNPYKGLPNGLLIYRSCYPIMYDKPSSTVQCQRSSIGLNVRIYKISIEAYMAINPNFNLNNKNNPLNKQINNVKFSLSTPNPTVDITFKTTTPNRNEFDVWREVDYYQFIRDSICKPMICPNFVQSYCYFVTNESQFDFSKNTLKIVSQTTAQKQIENTKKSVVILTESPNYNIYSWASNSYNKINNIQKQVYSGYKPDEIWNVVLSQMLIVFYVMYKYKFTFNDIQFEKNFYIKDLNLPNEATQFWIYRIDGFEYYLPNYGHLLVFDSDYHDIATGDKQKKYLNKMYSTDDETTIDNLLLNNIKNCTNNIFASQFTHVNGVPPTDKIIKKINDVNRDLNDITKYKEILHETLKCYLHNRVGTPLRTDEINNIRKDDVRPYKEGSILVYEITANSYVFVIYIKTQDENECICYSKQDNDITKISCNKSQLYNYSGSETIKQDIKPNEPSLNLDYMIEIYNI